MFLKFVSKLPPAEQQPWLGLVAMTGGRTAE
jgi:hypothetical protein